MVGSFPFFSKKGSSSVNPNLLFLYLFFVQSNGQELTSIAWWDRRFPRNREAWMYSRWTTAHIRSRGGNAVYLRVSATARFASSEWGRYVFVKLNWVVICCKMYFVSPCSSCAPGVMCFQCTVITGRPVCVCVCVSRALRVWYFISNNICIAHSGFTSVGVLNRYPLSSMGWLGWFGAFRFNGEWTLMHGL